WSDCLLRRCDGGLVKTLLSDFSIRGFGFRSSRPPPARTGRAARRCAARGTLAFVTACAKSGRASLCVEKFHSGGGAMRAHWLPTAAAAALVGAMPAHAQDAPWSPAPVNSDFNTAANWTPATVPTGTAFFGASTITGLTFNTGSVTSLGGFTFNAG